MADKIATEQEAYNVGKKGTPTANKCCTQARAIELGCAPIDYQSNQLVPQNQLQKVLTLTIVGPKYVRAKISSGFDFSEVDGVPTLFDDETIDNTPSGKTKYYIKFHSSLKCHLLITGQYSEGGIMWTKASVTPSSIMETYTESTNINVFVSKS